MIHKEKGARDAGVVDVSIAYNNHDYFLCPMAKLVEQVTRATAHPFVKLIVMPFTLQSTRATQPIPLRDATIIAPSVPPSWDAGR